jgi:hypothetical protein
MQSGTAEIHGAPAMRAYRGQRDKAAAIEREKVEGVFPPIGHQSQRASRLGEFRMLSK